MEKDLIKVYCDGGARGNPGPAAAAFAAYGQTGLIAKQYKYLGKTTNNVAEYNSVLLALEWLARQKALSENSRAIFFLDSQLVVRQLTGDYKVKSERLRPLAVRIKNLEKKVVTKISFRQVPRAKNKIADFLVNQCLDKNS